MIPIVTDDYQRAEISYPYLPSSPLRSRHFEGLEYHNFMKDIYFLERIKNLWIPRMILSRPISRHPKEHSQANSHHPNEDAEGLASHLHLLRRKNIRSNWINNVLNLIKYAFLQRLLKYRPQFRPIPSRIHPPGSPTRSQRNLTAKRRDLLGTSPVEPIFWAQWNYIALTLELRLGWKKRCVYNQDSIH